MPLFGAHMSIAGGLHNSLLAAKNLECETVQLFTASPSRWPVSATTGKDAEPRWQAKDLEEEHIRQFQQTLRDTKLRHPVAHDCYMINLASPDPGIFRRSLESFVMEMQRAEALGLSYLVAHPGAAVDGDEPAGLARIALALDEVHERCAGFKVRILLETTAGQGKTLGHRFEHLRDIFAQVKQAKLLGICLDTCHIFAAGYPLAPEDHYQATFAEFDRVIGLKNLKVFHINDSRKPQGSRVDRHAHIGQGCLGLEPFRLLVNDSRFRRHPMILETPKEGSGADEMDAVNLKVLRDLVV